MVMSLMGSLPSERVSAVIVALFLDEIRSLFKKVTFVIQLNSDEAIEEVENIKGTKKSEKVS